MTSPVKDSAEPSVPTPAPTTDRQNPPQKKQKPNICSVYDEPAHIISLKNKYCCVLSVDFPPKEETVYHSHNEDSLYIFLNNSTCRHTPITGEPFSDNLTQGGLRYRDHSNTPFIHKVQNIGEKNMRVFLAELLAKPPKEMQCTTPLSEDLVPQHKLELKSERVRGYRLFLKPHQVTQAIEYPFYGLLVSLSVGDVDIKITYLDAKDEDPPKQKESDWESKTFDLGSIVWLAGPCSVAYKNNTDQDFELVLAEWL
eukprot:TRINITY_DN1850_c0_g1_i1.p1 TRINITY_DN1850_c0_g1~~TRINITY_DN1850_c0_g1_i1.p1  ORF type:complete len:255 (-),score=21.11 TRINITY_DN1850_c0_g1_i1:62-826(-)